MICPRERCGILQALWKPIRGQQYLFHEGEQERIHVCGGGRVEGQPP